MLQDRRSVATRSSALKRSSCLHKLDPFPDDVGLLRVGGRLKNATTPYEVKHPIHIPKNDHVTVLLIRHHHVAQKHQGYGITHNGIRQAGYWVINGRSVVSHVVHACVMYRKLRGRAMEQKMADPGDPANFLTGASPMCSNCRGVRGHPPREILKYRTLEMRFPAFCENF